MLGQRYRKTFGRRYRTREQQEQPEQQKVLNKKCSYRRGFMDGFTDDAETGNGKQEYVAVALDGNLDIDNARNDDEHHTKHKGDTRVVEEVIAQEDDKYGHDPVAVDALEGDGVRVGRNSRGRFVAAVVGKRGRRRAAALDPPSAALRDDDREHKRERDNRNEQKDRPLRPEEAVRVLDRLRVLPDGRGRRLVPEEAHGHAPRRIVPGAAAAARAAAWRGPHLLLLLLLPLSLLSFPPPRLGQQPHLHGHRSTDVPLTDQGHGQGSGS